MNSGLLILQFLILTAVVSGTIIFFLHRMLIASTDGAVRRLNSETEATRTKQKELNEKIKEADEELAKRKKEAAELAKKMMDEAENKAREEREKLVTKARQEGEEILAKAYGTRDKVRKDVEKEMEMKVIDFAVNILSSVLSERTRGVLEKELVQEFLEGLEKMDMSKIAADVKVLDIVTVNPATDEFKSKVAGIIKTKLQRDVSINATTDPNIVGGVVLKFGSLALDGSLQNFMREKAIAMKQKIEEN